MKNTWVIMPGYNEEKYIRDVLKDLSKNTNNIIFVDDGSTDLTAKIARRFTDHVLAHEINLGKGAALKTGSEYAFKRLNAEAVIFMDSDGQHSPEDLKLFYDEIKNGHSAVFGVRRFRSDMPLVRFLGNKFSSVLINILFGVYFSDIPSGYKALTSHGYKVVKWKSQGYEVETEIAVRVAKNRLKFKEIPIKTIYLDTDKGFTMIDALRILLKLPLWLWS